MKMMANKIRAIAYCTILILAFAVCFLNVKAVPQMPHRFYGAVTVTGEPALDGTLIEAVINNITYASTITSDGKYGYVTAFNVPADDPDTPEIEGGKTDDLVHFYVARTYATNYTFAIGGITALNLSIVAPTAYAEFTADVTNGTEPLTVKFTDQSMYFDSITSRTWDFGDANITTTTVANITHTYIQNGTYTVSLTVNGTKAGLNITDTETKIDYITVYDSKPKADFYATPTSGPKPLTVSFYDNSTSYDGIISRIWDFGDANITTTTVANITHTYNTTGAYTVKLTVTEPDGDNDTIIKPNYITVQPTARLIEIISPTTENPIYTQSNQTIQITFKYTELEPLNATLKIYNATYTVLLITNQTAITPGTNMSVTANITIPETAPDGKYDLSITMFNTYNLNTTVTKTDAVIIDSTAPTITNVLQNPPVDNVWPTDTVEVNATVTDALSGIKNVTLLYSADGGETWTPVSMQQTGQVYSGTIPAFPNSTVVQYYIEAIDKAGNKEVSPEAEYYTYTVIPEFANMLVILLMLLTITAIAAIMKWKKGILH
jgi:PKD repeat protein